MRSPIITLLIILTVLMGATSAQARGGKDDCPPGSTDPDCAGAAGGR